MREVSTNTRWVYVVSSLAEAFGQLVREFVAICGTQESAARALAEIEEQESEFALSGDCELFELGVLRASAICA